MSQGQIEAIEVPTLVLVGAEAEDALVSPEIVWEVHELVNGSQYLEFLGWGHSVYLESGPALNEAIRVLTDRAS